MGLVMTKHSFRFPAPRLLRFFTACFISPKHLRRERLELLQGSSEPLAEDSVERFRGHRPSVHPRAHRIDHVTLEDSACWEVAAGDKRLVEVGAELALGSLELSVLRSIERRGINGFVPLGTNRLHHRFHLPRGNRGLVVGAPQVAREGEMLLDDAGTRFDGREVHFMAVYRVVGEADRYLRVLLLEEFDGGEVERLVRAGILRDTVEDGELGPAGGEVSDKDIELGKTRHPGGDDDGFPRRDKGIHQDVVEDVAGADLPEGWVNLHELLGCPARHRRGGEDDAFFFSVGSYRLPELERCRAFIARYPGIPVSALEV